MLSRAATLTPQPNAAPHLLLFLLLLVLCNTDADVPLSVSGPLVGRGMMTANSNKVTAMLYTQHVLASHNCKIM